MLGWIIIELNLIGARSSVPRREDSALVSGLHFQHLNLTNFKKDQNKIEALEIYEIKIKYIYL